MKAFSLIFIASMACVSALAQQVGPTEAQQRAYDFLHQVGSRHASVRTGSTDDLTLVYTSLRPSDNKTLYYVFNQSQDNGFVIIGGDESAREILAYCDKGSFDPDNLPDNFRWWLSQYDEQISAAIDQGPVDRNLYHQRAARRAAATASKKDISPLISTTWDQDAPYWNDIPYNEKISHFYTGCVATSTAQVMNYWECPITGTTGEGSNSFSRNYLISGTTYTVNFSSNFEDHSFDWANMSDSYSGDYTDEQAAAVAQLMYDCGVALKMQYGTSSSGAYSIDVQSVLANNFKYDATVTYKERANFSEEDWENLIYEELANNRPVIYNGKAPSGSGHSFICDGYDVDNDMYHFNWGWSGYCNAFCPLTGTHAIEPGGTGTGGAGADESYTIGQGATIHIMPDEGGVEQPDLCENNSSGASLYLSTTGTSSGKISSYDYKKIPGFPAALSVCQHCQFRKLSHLFRWWRKGNGEVFRHNLYMGLL